MKNTLLVFLTVVCMLFSLPLSADAAKKGELQGVDFTFKGVALGDTAAQMSSKLGEPDFDTDIIVLDQTVKCYVYSAKLKVCTDPRTDKVVAIICKDKEYRAREDVTYGSTRAKLRAVYGDAEKFKQDGAIYYLYRNPDDEKQKLMLSMEPINYYVEGWLITSLPITEEEAAEYEMGEFPTDLGNEPAEPALSGGFNSKGEWWTAYKINDNVTVGVAN